MADRARTDARGEASKAQATVPGAEAAPAHAPGTASGGATTTAPGPASARTSEATPKGGRKNKKRARWLAPARRLARRASLRAPLPALFAALRLAAPLAPRSERLVRFARRILGLGGPELRAFERRTFWGSNANLLIGARLDTGRAADVEPLLEPVDWSPMEAALRGGRGLLVAGAHLGPSRVLASRLTSRFPNTSALYWAEQKALPAHVVAVSDAAARRRSAVEGLITLRAGRVMLLAADIGSPGNDVTLPFMGGTLSLSRGAAALARLAGAPSLPAVATWRDGRIAIVFGDLIAPQAAAPADWERQWLEAYLRWLERWLRGPPENLRARGGGALPRPIG